MQLPSPKTLLKISSLTAVAAIVLKLLAWHVTGSVGLLSDGMESFVNLAGAVFSLMMVTIAERPADDEHPHGHHKAEYFSAGFEGVLIFGAALAILWTSIQRLLHPQPLESLDWGMALSMLSTLLNGFVAWLLLKGGKQYNSIALEGGGKHLRTDVYTSIGVVAGIGLAGWTGWHWLDPTVAILVAINILREGWELVYNSSQGLMDTAAEPEVSAKIDEILKSFETQDRAGKPEVRFDHVFTRAAGVRCFVTMHMHVPACWTLRKAADLRNQVELILLTAMPQLHASIELMPRDIEPHQVLMEDAKAQSQSCEAADCAACDQNTCASNAPQTCAADVPQGKCSSQSTMQCSSQCSS